MIVTSYMCGSLPSEIVCIGLVFWQREPRDDLTCVDELSYELHGRFEAKFGCKTCGELRGGYMPLRDNNTCEYVYKEGARMAIELILGAPQLIDRCPKRG